MTSEQHDTHTNHAWMGSENAITRSSDQYRFTKNIKNTIIYQFLANFIEYLVMSSRTHQDK